MSTSFRTPQSALCIRSSTFQNCSEPRKLSSFQAPKLVYSYAGEGHRTQPPHQRSEAEVDESRIRERFTAEGGTTPLPIQPSQSPHHRRGLLFPSPKTSANTVSRSGVGRMVSSSEGDRAYSRSWYQSRVDISNSAGSHMI